MASDCCDGWGLPYLLWLLLNNNINIRVWAGAGLTGVLHWLFFYYSSQSTALLRPVFSDGKESHVQPPAPVASQSRNSASGEGDEGGWEVAVGWKGKPVAQGSCPCSASFLFHLLFLGPRPVYPQPCRKLMAPVFQVVFMYFRNVSNIIVSSWTPWNGTWDGKAAGPQFHLSNSQNPGGEWARMDTSASAGGCGKNSSQEWGEWDNLALKGFGRC